MAKVGHRWRFTNATLARPSGKRITLSPGPQLGYVFYCQTLQTIQPGFVAKFVNEHSSRRRQSFFSKRKRFSSSILLLSSSCACSSFLCRLYSVLVRSSSRFFLVQHAVFLLPRSFSFYRCVVDVGVICVMAWTTTLKKWKVFGFVTSKWIR